MAYSFFLLMERMREHGHDAAADMLEEEINKQENSK